MLPVLDDIGTKANKSGQSTDRALDWNRPDVELRTLDGAMARRAGTGDGETLQIVDRRGDLIFEYDPATGKSRLTVEQGDLELVAKHGDIRLRSSGVVSLEGEEVAINAKLARYQIEETTFTGGSFTASLKTARVVVGRLERLAREVVEKSETVCTRVSGLIQMKAGRMRTLVAGSSQLKSHRIYMKADTDCKIKGEKIHLG